MPAASPAWKQKEDCCVHSQGLAVAVACGSLGGFYGRVGVCTGTGTGTHCQCHTAGATHPAQRRKLLRLLEKGFAGLLQNEGQSHSFPLNGFKTSVYTQIGAVFSVPVSN